MTSTAEEALTALARDLVEEIGAGRALELARAEGSEGTRTGERVARTESAGTSQRAEAYESAVSAGRFLELAAGGQSVAVSPLTGARAVHPHLGTRHVTALAGDTMSGTAHLHVPRPFEVPEPSAEAKRAMRAEEQAARAEQRAQRAAGTVARMREEKQNAAVLEQMGLPAEGEYQPLTDEQHALHTSQLEQKLHQAHGDGLATDQAHTLDGTGHMWHPDRASVHADIVRDYLDKQVDVPSQRSAVLLGGLPSAGKSSLLRSHKDHAIVSHHTFTEELARRGMIPEVAGHSPMEASPLVHEESRHLARLAMAGLLDRGKNLALDMTMKSADSARPVLQQLKGRGYHVTGVLHDTPADRAAEGVRRRHRSQLEAYRRGKNPLGGRYIPEAAIRGAEAEPGVSAPRKAFDVLKPEFDQWEHHDGTTGQLAGKSAPPAQSPGSGIPSAEELRRRA